jgi:P27 family predicted phage terminase small subunit
MAKPGPAPKPTNIKILEGNPGKRAMNRHEPRPSPVAPPMPRNLPALAQKFWKDIAPRLEALGILTEVDGPAFTAMAIHYAKMIEATVAMKKDGQTKKDYNGNPVKNPMDQVLRENSTQFRQWCSEFGLTPASRAKLQVPDPDKDLADEFFGY